MDEQPDLVDDTFLLAGRAAAYCPRLLLVPQLLPQLLDTALVSDVRHFGSSKLTLSSLLHVAASTLSTAQGIRDTQLDSPCLVQHFMHVRLWVVIPQAHADSLHHLENVSYLQEPRNTPVTPPYYKLHLHALQMHILSACSLPPALFPLHCH
jgi:hypothetical protein